MHQTGLGFPNRGEWAFPVLLWNPPLHLLTSLYFRRGTKENSLSTGRAGVGSDPHLCSKWSSHGQNAEQTPPPPPREQPGLTLLNSQALELHKTPGARTHRTGGNQIGIPKTTEKTVIQQLQEATPSEQVSCILLLRETFSGDSSGCV